MRDPVTGNPHTAHTTNPVPFLMVGDGLKFKEPLKPKADGAEAGKEKESEVEEDPPAICDVAPTILDIMVRFFVLFFISWICCSRLCVLMVL